MNEYTRTCSTLVIALLFLSIAIRSAGAIRGEKDRDTFVSLMTTPLSTERILWGKWWGCMLGNRRLLIWLLTIWGLGLATGGLSFLAIPGMLLAFITYMSGFAWIGLWFSCRARTTLRAMTYSLVTCIFLGGGYLILISMCCLMPFADYFNWRGRDLDNMMGAFCGFSPGVVSAFLPFWKFDEQEMEFISRDDSFLLWAVAGWILWVGISVWVSRMTQAYFSRDNNRFPMRRPLLHAMRRRD